MLGAAKLLIGSCAAALLAAGMAHAQSTEPVPASFTLQGAPISPVQVLDGAVISSLGEPARQARQDGEPVAAASSLGAAGDATGSALPWYERFTVSTPSEFRSAWGETATELNFSAGDRWGFTLGIAEQEQGPHFELEDVSAGAFYELNSRFRVGTNLRFASPTEDVFGQDGEVHVPELKFESAFRF